LVHFLGVVQANSQNKSCDATSTTFSVGFVLMRAVPPYWHSP
jgi:hypothetical protein